MPKLKGPLFSLSAQGALAKLLTFRRHSSETVAGLPTTHPDPASPAQLSWRTMYEACSALWHTLSSAEQQAWESNARAKHMTGYALWQSQCLRPNPGIYLPLAGGTMTGDILMAAHKITGLPAPTLDPDAATKAYVDAGGGGVFDWTTKYRLILPWNSIDAYYTDISPGGSLTPNVSYVKLTTDAHTNDYCALCAFVVPAFDPSLATKITFVTEILAFQDSNNRDCVFGLDDYVTFPPTDLGVYLRFYIDSANKLYITSSNDTDFEKVDTGVVVPTDYTGKFKIVYTPLTQCDFYYNDVLVGTLTTYLPPYVIDTICWCIVALSDNSRSFEVGLSYIEIET